MNMTFDPVSFMRAEAANVAKIIQEAAIRIE